MHKPNEAWGQFTSNSIQTINGNCNSSLHERKNFYFPSVDKRIQSYPKSVCIWNLISHLWIGWIESAMGPAREKNMIMLNVTWLNKLFKVFIFLHFGGTKKTFKLLPSRSVNDVTKAENISSAKNINDDTIHTSLNTFVRILHIFQVSTSWYHLKKKI